MYFLLLRSPTKDGKPGSSLETNFLYKSFIKQNMAVHVWVYILITIMYRMIF